MPSVTTPAAAPGWYGDPAGARVLRWWNGQEWTDDVAARGYEPLPSALLEKEQTAAGRAHLALVGLIVAQVLLALVYVWFVRRIVDEIDAAIDSDGDDPLEFGLEGLAVQPFALAMLGSVWSCTCGFMPPLRTHAPPVFRPVASPASAWLPSSSQS